MPLFRFNQLVPCRFTQDCEPPGKNSDCLALGALFLYVAHGRGRRIDGTDVMGPVLICSNNEALCEYLKQQHTQFPDGNTGAQMHNTGASTGAG